MNVFGFEYSGRAFSCFKTIPTLDRGPRLMSSADIEVVLFMGLGKTSRKQTETCWLCRRGSPKRLSAGVREVIISPMREHSRKPDEFYRRVEELCRGPRLDLFCRETRPGWVPYGDETGKFDSGEAA
jgi:N6-adenosine-specific RNA methylase IME4